MHSDGVKRAVAAVRSVAATLDLATEDVDLIHNSNKLALRLLPCDVFARVASIGQEVAALEVDIAGQLAATEAPVVALDPRVEPRVYHCDGFAITWWTYHDTSPNGQVSPARYAQSLERLHAAMRSIETPTPHALDRVAEAEHLVASPDRTPELDPSGRDLLRRTFSSWRQELHRRRPPEQLLHGEPHPGNVLNTAAGPRYIDLETCCRGPVEFDVAHAPEDVGAHYPNLDRDLLDQCRGLVLAMVAAWRWDADDEFPDGRRHRHAILDILRNGPPWPALGDLTSR